MILNILEKFLIHIGKSKLYDTLKYVLHELIKNANKGNYKRAHFKFKNYDLQFKHRIGLNDFLSNLKEKKDEYINKNISLPNFYLSSFSYFLN